MADLQVRIAEETIVVDKKVKETNELLVVVGQESIIVEEESAKAAVEEAGLLFLSHIKTVCLPEWSR